MYKYICIYTYVYVCIIYMRIQVSNGEFKQN